MRYETLKDPTPQTEEARKVIKGYGFTPARIMLGALAIAAAAVMIATIFANTGPA